MATMQSTTDIVHDEAGTGVHEQHKKGRQFRWILVFMTLVMGFGSIAYGYAAGVISTTLIQPHFISYMGLDTNPHANDWIGLTGSLFQAGGFFGTFTVSPIADRWGRRIGIAAPALFLGITTACQAASVNMQMFVAFRFLSGFASYNLVCSVPLWMAEVAPPNIRGRLVDLHGAMLLTGLGLAAYVGYGFYKLDTPNAWRGHQAVNAALVIPLLAGLYFLPESPRWLLMQDRHEDAQKVLRLVHAPEEADVELRQISRQVILDQRADSSWWSIIKNPSYRMRALLGCGTWFFIQFSGSQVLNNYGPTLYRALGYDSDKQLIYQIGWLTLALGGGIFAMVIVDWFPRPKLIAFGVMFCVICLAIEAALVATYATPEALENPNRAALGAAVAMLYLYVFVWEMMLDGTQFVYVSELFPNHLRAKGLSMALASFCAINIMWLQAAPIGFANIGWKFYLAFIIPGALASVFMWFKFPDTKGIPLEEVAAIFGDQGELSERDLVTAEVIAVKTGVATGEHHEIEHAPQVSHPEVKN